MSLCSDSEPQKDREGGLRRRGMWKRAILLLLYQSGAAISAAAASITCSSACLTDDEVLGNVLLAPLYLYCRFPAFSSSALPVQVNGVTADYVSEASDLRACIELRNDEW